jgi:transglutaminase-like putative cysteine protease
MSKNTVNVLTLSNKQLFWIILSVLVSVFPHLPRLPIWFPLLMVFVVTCRWGVAVRKIKPLPKLLVALITIIVFLAIIYFQGLSLNREISVTILTTMTVLKLLETLHKRDAWMVVMLCYFVILTRFFYNQDMLLVFYLLFSVFIITHTLFIIQHDNEKTFFQRKEIRQTISLLLTGLPLAALFFLFFPRLGAPIWGSPDFFGEGKTGISEEMSPGSLSQLFNDDSTAFRATFNSQIPAQSQLYWRGPVMWDFDGKTWTRNKHQDPVIRHKNFPRKGVQVSYEIELEPTGQHYLFALDYVNNAPKNNFLLPDSELLSPNKRNQLSHYKLSSTLKTYNPYELLSKKQLQRLTNLPRGYNPKTTELIKNWKKTTINSEQLINRILNWFATDAFYYSYSPPLLQGDTVDQFLFNTKTGFCEHYASAFTVMMRAAGIPTRVVTGYQGGILNEDYLLIKQSDAHAWSEVWISGKGWLRVDPTAAVSPLRVELGSQALMSEKSRSWHDSGWLRKMGEKYDGVRHKWNKWVRDYNVIKQKALFEIFGFNSQDGKTIAIILGSIMLTTSVFMLLLLYFIRPKRTLSSYDKIYQKFLKITTNKQNIKYNNQGILEFSKSAIVKYPQAENAINDFAQLYLQLRFSKHTPKTKALNLRLKSLLDAIKLNINQHTPGI